MSKRNEILIAIVVLLLSGSVLFWSIRKLDAPESLIPIASVNSEFPDICILFQNNPIISLKADIFNDQMASLIIKGQYKLDKLEGATDHQTRSFQGYLSFNPIGYLYEAAFELNLNEESKLHLKTEGTSTAKINMSLQKNGAITQEKELLVNGPLLHSTISEKDGVSTFNILFPAKLSANLGSMLGGSEAGIKPEISKYFTAKVSRDAENQSSCNTAPINAVIPFGNNIFGALGSSISASEKQ